MNNDFHNSNFFLAVIGLIGVLNTAFIGSSFQGKMLEVERRKFDLERHKFDLEKDELIRYSRICVTRYGTCDVPPYLPSRFVGTRCSCFGAPGFYH